MSNNRPNRPQNAAGASVAPSADIGAEVARLISIGKCKDAVERAKENHKRVKTPESEKLLVDAYVARIKQFQEKGQVENARDLIRLVKQTYPAHADRFEMLETTTAASGGLVDQLVAPLARPDISDEQRETIETAIRQRLVDIQALADCTTLPDSHTLKVAAKAIWRAFEAAATGPVTDEAIALAEVSRKSPLMGWRMLIRAIAAFARNDDEGCRRSMEAIPADAAVHKLTPVLLDMMQSKSPGRGAVGALQSRIAGGDKALRDAMEMIETSFNRQDIDGLIHGSSAALRAAEISRPELVDTMRQRLAVRCIVGDVPPGEINRVVGAARKDAAFWRMLAHGFEQVKASIFAGMAWERFIRHAVSEKMFSDQSLEAAIVYLRMAEVMALDPLEALQRFKKKLAGYDYYTAFYKNQPPDIAALAPKDRFQTYERAMDVNGMFRDAARILKDTDTYSKWSLWSQYHKLPVKQQEDILVKWHTDLPRDLDPILRLSFLAEDRNALSMATKRLAEAEAIDAFNPKVRKARVRLILATLWRHMKDRKAHLVEKDLAELEALPAFNEGDRSAFLWAARVIWQQLRNDADAGQNAVKEVMARVGDVAGPVLVNSVAYHGKVDRSLLPLAPPAIVNAEPLTIALADARLMRLTKDLAFTYLRPIAWNDQASKVLKQKPCPLSLDDTLALGRGALDNNAMPLAYAASAAGLQTASGAMAARFLLLRAMAVSEWSSRRAKQCYLAALDMARQVHDDDLMKEITDAMSDDRRLRYTDNGGKPMEGSTLADILAAERKAGDYPKTNQAAEKHVVLIENDFPFGGGFFNPFGGGGAFDEDDYDDDDFDDDDDDEDDFDYFPPTGRGMPDLNDLGKIDPKALAELQEMFKNLGKRRKK